MLKRMPYGVKLLLALILGGAMTFSYAPFYQWYLGPLLIAGMLFLTEKESARRSLFLGWSFGLGLFTIGLWWINISLHMFGGAPFVFAILVVVLLSLYLGLYYGLLMWLIRRFTKNNIVAYGLYFPILGVFLEFVRGKFLTGFPWLALGYLFTDTEIAHWLFPVMGALMSSFWIYWLAGILYLGVSRLLTHSYDDDSKKQVVYIMPIILGVIIAGTVYFVDQKYSDTIEPFADPLKVALLQGDIDQEDKFENLTFWENIDTYVEMTLANARDNDLIIWPETAIADVYVADSELEKNLHRVVEEDQVNLFIGIFTGSYENSHFENSIVSFGPNEGEIETYSKQHLLPFGEYIPLRGIFELFETFVYIPFSDLTPGKPNQTPFSLLNSEAKGSASICYEAVFGDEMRSQAKQSQFLVNVSNDAWFGDSHGPWQHLQITRARTIEMARPMLRATNDGITLFIDEKGRTQSMADRFVTTALVDQIQPMQGLTAYVKVGDRFWLILLGALFVLSFVFDRWIFSSMKRQRAVTSVENTTTEDDNG